MIRKILFVLVLLLTGGVFVRYSIADDDDEFAASALHAANDIKWSQTTVKILDPEGNPVVGAKVRPWMLLAGNGHGPWNEITHGAPQTTVTNADGRTNVVFPQSEQRSESPVVRVWLIVTHPDFCSKSSHVNVPVGDPPIVPIVALERGVRLRIAGVAPGSDRPLSDCHVMLENADVEDSEFVQEFVQDMDGWMQSVPVREDRRWFRVIRTPPGRPAEFSKPQAWSPEDPASREVRVEVRPGIRVTGKISDDVARPIERGHVVAWCGSPVRQEPGNNQQRARPIMWVETVPVWKDATFEFSSLPSGYLAQFFAIANDSISAQPTDEAYETCCKWFAKQNRNRETAFRYGQVLRLSGVQTQITIEMEPAGQVRVKCVDLDGHPLRRIKVSSWPNQLIVGAGPSIFCTGPSSLDQLHNKGRFNWLLADPFTAETNANGEAFIVNLPQGQQSLTTAGNEFWTSNQRLFVVVNPDKTTEATLKLRRTAR